MSKGMVTIQDKEDHGHGSKCRGMPGLSSVRTYLTWGGGGFSLSCPIQLSSSQVTTHISLLLICGFPFQTHPENVPFSPVSPTVTLPSDSCKYLMALLIPPWPLCPHPTPQCSQFKVGPGLVIKNKSSDLTRP